MRSHHVLVVPVLAGLLCAGSALAQPKPAAPSASAPAPAPAAPGKMTSAELSTQIQKAYQSINAYEADFEQQYAMKAFGQTKSSKGHVAFVKPGKMRWDYNDPAEQKGNVVVSDGTTLWSYSVKDKQARKMMVKDSQMPTALAFLTGKGELSKDFNLELMDPAKLKFEGGYVLKATPKTATNLYNFVLFYVDGATFHVRRVLIVDGQDNRNRFDFSKPAVNGTVKNDLFQWSPPAGVNVVQN